MSKHKRCPNYWKYYHMARVRESPFLIETVADMVRKHPSPQPHADRGRPPIHSKEKMDFICVLMVARNVSLRDMESDLHTMKTPWDGEPVPDHTTIWTLFDEIDEDYTAREKYEIKSSRHAANTSSPL